MMQIAPGDLIPTPDNPRILNIGTDAWHEFVESIRAQGVRIPVIARLHPEHQGKFDLRAGARRVAAAREAGLESVPTLVHAEMSDEDAMNLTVVENLEREDLTPLEEGAGVATLLKVHNGDYAAVAARLGRTERWVRLRGKLQDLTDHWRDAIRDGIPNSWDKDERLSWTAGHYGLIARMPADVQDAMLDEYRRSMEQWSIKDLAEWIDKEFLRLLRKAPWPLDSADLLRDVGACEACPSRSDREALLFHDLQEDLAKTAQCLDPACWKRKLTAWCRRRIVELRQEHPDLQLISSTGVLYQEQEAARTTFSEPLLNEYQYDSAKKADKDSIPALVVAGDKGVGTIRWIKVRSDESSAGGGGASKRGSKTMKQKRAELASKRAAHMLKALKTAVSKLKCEALPETLQSSHGMIALAAAFGTNHKNGCYGNVTVFGWRRSKSKIIDPWAYLADALAGSIGARRELWRSVRPVLASRVTYNGGMTQVPYKMAEEAARMASRLGIDLEALIQAAVEAIPEPKAWAKAEAATVGKKAKGTKGTKTARKPKAPKAPKPDTSAVEYWGYTDDHEPGATFAICGMSQGIGGKWFAARHIPDVDGERRIKSKNLPLRETKAEAQADLNAWATKKGLKPCCRVCGCTDDDCTQCVEKTGEPCTWTEPGLCSACAEGATK